jgi:hypothetical protein
VVQFVRNRDEACGTVRKRQGLGVWYSVEETGARRVVQHVRPIGDACGTVREIQGLGLWYSA